MAIRYGDRSRVSTPVSGWLNLRGNSIPYRTTSVGTSSNVTITANASAHTYGAWTEVVSSLTNDTRMLSVAVGANRTNGTNTAGIISFGTGASGSESEFVAFAIGGVGEPGFANIGVFVSLPIALQAGTRISARLQSIVTGGKTCVVSGVTAFDADPYGYAFANKSLDSLGINTSTSVGTDLPASSVYAQIVASTTQTYQGLVLVPSMAAASTPASSLFMTVAVGGAGAEVDLGSLICVSTSGESLFSQPSFFIPAVIPAGSRIAVKQNVASAVYDVTVIGVPF